MADPKGYLFVPVAFRADGSIHALELNASDHLKVEITNTNLMETPHNLLDGAINQDTEAGTVAEGDLIIGIDTGSGVIKWKTKTRGATDQIIQVQADGSLEWVDPPSSGFSQCARVYNNAAITLTTATMTKLTFNSERYDTDAIHSTSVDTGRLTCKTAGKYHITANVLFVANATGQRQTRVLLNNTTVIAIVLADAVATAGVGTAINLGCDYDLAVNDYVELEAYQSSGGNLNVNSAGNYSPEFSMFRFA